MRRSAQFHYSYACLDYWHLSLMCLHHFDRPICNFDLVSSFVQSWVEGVWPWCLILGLPWELNCADGDHASRVQDLWFSNVGPTWRWFFLGLVFSNLCSILLRLELLICQWIAEWLHVCQLYIFKHHFLQKLSKFVCYSCLGVCKKQAQSRSEHLKFWLWEWMLSNLGRTKNSSSRFHWGGALHYE